MVDKTRSHKRGPKIQNPELRSAALAIMDSLDPAILIEIRREFRTRETQARRAAIKAAEVNPAEVKA